MILLGQVTCWRVLFGIQAQFTIVKKIQPSLIPFLFVSTEKSRFNAEASEANLERPWVRRQTKIYQNDTKFFNMFRSIDLHPQRRCTIQYKSYGFRDDLLVFYMALHQCVPSCSSTCIKKVVARIILFVRMEVSLCIIYSWCLQKLFISSFLFCEKVELNGGSKALPPVYSTCHVFLCTSLCKY